MNLGKMVFIRIYTHQNVSYIWPVTKHIYPMAVLPIIEQKRKYMKQLDKEFQHVQSLWGVKG